MKLTHLSALLFATTVAVSPPIFAQTAQLPATAKATELRPADGWKAFSLGDTPDAKIQVVKSDAKRFDQILRASNTKQPSNPYNIQMRAPLEAAIKKGDVLSARFWMRTIATTDETGQGTAALVVERAGEPYTKAIVYEAHAGEQWQEFMVPFVAVEDSAAGELNLIFRLGYTPQTVELAGLSLRSYGDTVKLADLPRTRISYVGQQADAPWRREAAMRIDRLRKADLKIRVVDRDGKPVPKANLRVDLTNSAYKFGSAISSDALFSSYVSDADKAKYREVYARNFNYSVIENGLKWANWDNTERRPNTLYTAGWLNGSNIDLRGHVLVWPSWEHLPAELEKLKDDKPALRAALRSHILDEAGAMRGLVTQWDVINEPFTNHDLMDILGRDVMVDWFKAAREADPNARLYINDYAILSGGSRNSDHQQDYEKTIQFLVENGAPIGGIGMQGHMGESYTPPTELWKVLDRYGKFGLPITITEFDIASDDEAAQGDYLRDFLTAMFAHPTTDGVMMWGFWEGVHWKPNAALWRRDWTPKSAGEMWQKLVREEWTTRASGASDAQGNYQIRGFKGDYRITAQQGGRFATANAKLDKDGDMVTLILP